MENANSQVKPFMLNWGNDKTSKEESSGKNFGKQASVEKGSNEIEEPGGF